MLYRWPGEAGWWGVYRLLLFVNHPLILVTCGFLWFNLLYFVAHVLCSGLHCVDTACTGHWLLCFFIYIFFIVHFTVCEHSSVGGFASFIHYVYGVFEHGAALWSAVTQRLPAPCPLLRIVVHVQGLISFTRPGPSSKGQLTPQLSLIHTHGLILFASFLQMCVCVCVVCVCVFGVCVCVCVCVCVFRECVCVFEDCSR